MSTVKPPPIIDFSAFYSGDAGQKKKLVHEVRDACLEKGFFQLVGHGVSPELQRAIFEQSAEFFALPLAEKMKCDKNLNTYNRGYEMFRAQKFEPNQKGDLKEGFYFGRDLSPDNPSVKAGTFGCGPNVYPSGTSDPARFKAVIDEYHKTMRTLAEAILSVIAETLDLPGDWFEEYTRNPLAILRLLHYPPQAADASEEERGIGAHTDFGGVTLLLQDDVGGLQVFDAPTSSWIDVRPTPGALVINLGNLMMRWSNDRYISNLHRVINKSGRERYSIPFFFSGNPDFVVHCLPNCTNEGQAAKYPAIKVEEWMLGRYADTYGGANKEKAMGDLVPEVAAA